MGLSKISSCFQREYKYPISGLKNINVHQQIRQTVSMRNMSDFSYHSWKTFGAVKNRIDKKIDISLDVHCLGQTNFKRREWSKFKWAFRRHQVSKMSLENSI